MDSKFSPRVKDVISFSREEALRLGHDFIGTEHLMLGLIREGEGMAIKFLKTMNVRLPELRKSIENALKSSATSSHNLTNIPLTKQAEKALKITYLEAKIYKSELIGTEHLLLAILKDEDSSITKILNQYGVSYDLMREEMDAMRSDFKAESSQNPPDDDSFSTEEDRPSYSSTTKKIGDGKSKTPVLDNFGRDLTRAAEEGKLDPIVGKKKLNVFRRF